MAKTNFKSVDEYIASQPEEVRGVLGRVRGAIRKAVPKADEVISYQIPAYKVDGRAVIYFSGWKEHYSLHPASKQVLAAFGKELAGHHVSKGTIRFPFTKVPVTLITGITKVRAKEVAREGKPEAGLKKKRS